MSIFTALITFRPEKPFGVGRTAHERGSRIVAGYRGEITDGLPDGLDVYTGVCASREECKAELVGHLRRQGLSGTLRFA